MNYAAEAAFLLASPAERPIHLELIYDVGPPSHTFAFGPANGLSNVLQHTNGARDEDDDDS